MIKLTLKLSTWNMSKMAVKINVHKMRKKNEYQLNNNII